MFDNIAVCSVKRELAGAVIWMTELLRLSFNSTLRLGLRCTVEPSTASLEKLPCDRTFFMATFLSFAWAIDAFKLWPSWPIYTESRTRLKVLSDYFFRWICN